METNSFKITIVKNRKPIKDDLNEELQWLFHSLGLFTNRDKEKSCFRILIELIKSNKDRKILSSEKIAERANLSRATVVYHINKLVESGLVRSDNKRYMLRVERLEGLISEVENDIFSVLDEIKKAARDIDRELEFV